jgi:hypothetical protein
VFAPAVFVEVFFAFLFDAGLVAGCAAALEFVSSAKLAGIRDSSNASTRARLSVNFFIGTSGGNSQSRFA